MRRKNRKGNIYLNFLLFILALGVVVAFISPINTFLDMAQQSDNLNCRGYIHLGNETNPLSFNDTMDGGESGSPLACIAIRLYLPYILLVFLVGGFFTVMAGGRNYFDSDPVR